MKITIYELLGLIKDGKAPKKIKIDETIFERTSSSDITQIYNYWNRGYNHFWLTTYTILLDDEVEILDEEDEFIDIEELDVEYDDDGRIDGVYMARPEVEERKKINDLIKNQKKIIERLDKSE